MIFKVRVFLGLCVALFSLKADAIYIFAEGGGTVSPDLTGKNLIAGRTYTLIAKPTPGYTFDHWTVSDYYASVSSKLRFAVLNGLLYLEDGTNRVYAGPINADFTAHFLAKTIIPGSYIGI